ncbi:excinuclease ABC subunit A [Parcubacteria bacterium DG_74_2]|nr:MAG: excinuclease ABC subunit A [Parcubacteria bacterium DG_74_2]
MPQDYIKIRRARVHNLRNIDLDIPKGKFIVITGISGSGKSSLAFDTLYAEGQRRYVESLSAYARQFLGVMQKPDVDKIEGISPAISIDQRKAAHNPRSTVGTVTEIYDYLRLLFARVGIPHCPKCGRVVTRQTIDQITEQVLKLKKRKEITILGPVIRGRKGEHHGVLEEIQRTGFLRVRINGIIYRIEETLEKKLDRYKKHNIEVLVDRLILDENLDRNRLVDSLETGLKLGKGIVVVNSKSGDLIFSELFACPKCEISLPEIEPRLFSFNSPYGACSSCQGLGEKLEVDPNLVMPNKNLSLDEGAIFAWGHASHRVGRQGYFRWQLEDLAQRYNFSLSVPVKKMPVRIIHLILYGGEDFEGVIPWLERKYHETESDYAREEIKKYMIEKKCEICKGKRLKPEVLAVKVAEKSIADVSEMQIDKAKDFFEKLISNPSKKLTENKMKIGRPILKEILNRLQFLIDVGLDYITIGRKTDSLSGGEEERVKLATQIGSKLAGVLYILDEPSVGLHPRDQGRLIETLKKLRDLGNTIVVVEHDPQTILAADWIIDIGPGAGKKGGKIVFEGTPKKLLKTKTLTGDYLSGRKKVEVLNQKSFPKYQKYLIIKGAREHNLKNIDVKIPLGKFVCIAGVSGSGKSSLMNDVLARALMREFYNSKEEAGVHDKIIGIENLNKVILVDQSPIGRTPRSNPATYTGAFTFIRHLFSQTKEAKIRGYGPGRFSFNVKGGRCEACQGQGVKKIEMYFLPDLYILCDECKGRRFNKETLEIEYRGKNISDILKMTVEGALVFFQNIPGLFSKLKTLTGVGLGYIQLGQSATSLSGGEAQRVKLATELSKKGTGKTLYILDEPTTGLHPDDIKKLVLVLKRLVEKENTILIIEHNLDVIKNSDWIIDLGPEGGEKGGYVVAQGTPHGISKNKKSFTGKYLKKVLST